MISHHQYERYHRQLILKELGEAGQEKLLFAKVLVVGAGGLGCPVLQYLVAAGVGTIGIVDNDEVTLSNLHRQVLYDINDLGKSKTSRVTKRLSIMNPGARINEYPLRLTNQNAISIFQQYDIVVDASDNFPTRYLVNDACVLLSLPLVYGAVSQFEGQVSVFNIPIDSNQRTVNYRDLFPHSPEEGEIPNCAEAGVIGVLPGIIGAVMAGEVIKLITGIGSVLVNQLQTFNFLNNQWHSWRLAPNPQSKLLLPENIEQYVQFNYEYECAGTTYSEIDATEFDTLLAQPDLAVIDVREYGEEPLVNEFAHTQIPLSELRGSDHLFEQNRLVFVCQSGQRSRKAAQLVSERFPGKKIYSLKSGIAHWKSINNIKNHE